MKLREYLEELNKMVVGDNKILDYEVVASIDDEGNGYNPVYFSPSLGLYEDGEFTARESFEEYEIGVENENAICIN